MARAFNFYAGPATLPQEVLEQAHAELLDYQGLGLSLIETSHRSPEYDAIHESAIASLRELLNIDDSYHVLLLGGGATLQFGMVPMNLMAAGQHCDLVHSGAWAKKALVDAKKVGSVNLVYDGKADNYTTLPEAASVKSSPGSRYLHITSNETIGGVQWQEFPATEAPLVADMTSDILSRPIPVDRFGLIYAGAQKNLGPAGVTIVIIRKELLERCPDTLPEYLSYKTHAESNSLYNTPPVFAIYIVKLVLDWIRRTGGLAAMAERNARKAAALYAAIDNSGGYYRCPVDPRYRSKMNVVFRLPTEELEKAFVAAAGQQHMLGLAGHRSVGGIRASIYYAMPEAGVQALIELMSEFARRG